MQYDVFISYRKKVSGDKPELLWQILEHSGYKSRVSFDKDNLIGEFNPNLVKRIDNCKDFILLIFPNTFDGCDSNNEAAAEFYKKLTNLPIEDFLKEVRELENLPKEELAKRIAWEGDVKDAHIDYLRIEVNRALNRRAKEYDRSENDKIHIIPLTYSRSEKYSFSELDLPSDLRPIKQFQAVFYTDSEEERFNRIIPELKKKMRSIPTPDNEPAPRIPWRHLLVACSLILFVVCGFFVWKDYQSYKRCQSINDYSRYLEEGQGIFNRHAQKHIKAINELLEFPNCTDEIKSLVKDKDYTHLTRLQAEALNEILVNMVFVHGGKFLMGADDEKASRKEKPRHEVVVDDFFIGKFEVSRYEWNAIKGASLSTTSRDSLDMPVTKISWDEVSQWIECLNTISGLNFTLPHEKEWEYAAIGGIFSDKTNGIHLAKYIYAGSDELTEVAWSSADSLELPRPRQRDGVKWYRKNNELGLYNMSGNVAEMCSNQFYYYDASQKYLGSAKAVRGGSFASYIPHVSCTVTARDRLAATSTSHSVGFRIVLKK